MSQKCPTCQRTLAKPPSYEELLRKYPDVHPSFIVNHNYLRCRWCDLQTANKRAIEAELPPPKYTNPVKEVEEQIQKAKSFIEQGAFKDDMERILPRMRQRLADLIKERDRGIRNAWLEYWGIWGKEDGPIDL